MKKKLIRSFIKSAVPEFASDLKVKVVSSHISIYSMVTLDNRTSTTSIADLNKVSGTKSCFHSGLWDTDPEKASLVVDFSDYKSHKTLREFLLPLLNKNLERCRVEHERFSWAFVCLSHDQSVTIRLDEIQAKLFRIFKDELVFDRDKYSISFDIDSDFKLNLHPISRKIVSIELEDLQFPPDQGTMVGGYTVTSFLHGCDLKFDSSFVPELKKLIADPKKYLGIDRDCCFSDKNSKFHNDPDLNAYAECFH